MTTTVMALPSIMDPMYWLGEGGLFASAVLPGILVIVFIETVCCFPCCRVTRCCSPAACSPPPPARRSTSGCW
jgi:hypothetical protein